MTAPLQTPTPKIQTSNVVRNHRHIALLDPATEKTEGIWNGKELVKRVEINGQPALTFGAELILTSNGPKLGVHFEYIEPWWKRLWKRRK